MVVVDAAADEEEERVDEEGTEVLDYEDGAPGYLGACKGGMLVAVEQSRG